MGSVLVTGGAGFIGSHLVERLVKRGYEVLVVDNLLRGKIENLSNVINEIKFIREDITDYTAMKNLIESSDIVFHLAAVSRVMPSIKNPELCFEYNSKGTEIIARLCSKYNKKLIIDPKKDLKKYQNSWMIKPNKKELSLAVGMDINNEEDLKKCGWQLKKELNLDYLLVTLSEEGMALFGEEYIKIPTIAKEVYDVTGAGDTVLACLGYYLSKNDNLIEAINFANSAAAVVVGKLGSATVTVEEIKEFQKKFENGTDYKIVNFETIEILVKRFKSQNKKIVFTNGCFDLLHIGHIKYLQKAKTLGDILIVGVNSNESIARLKGEERPINDEYERAYLLASLEVVDYVVIFDENTPYNLIQKIEPDILTKGADYKNKEVIGSDIAKQVVLIDYIYGKSTTNIIKRIKSVK